MSLQIADNSADERQLDKMVVVDIIAVKLED